MSILGNEHIMSAQSLSAAKRRKAFTLVEMLVVISIIGVLAALAARGIMGALSTAKNTAIKTEIDQIDAALKSFKEKYGSYPPCNLAIVGTAQINTDARNGLKIFLARAFSRYNPGAWTATAAPAQLVTDLESMGINTSQFEPSKALIFWLSGLSPDPQSPLAGSGTRISFFSFDKTRFIDQETFVDANNNGHWDSGETINTAAGASGQRASVYDLPTGYRGKYGTLPLVYLDYRSYMLGATVVGSSRSGPILTLHHIASDSYVMPYLVQAASGARNTALDQDFVNADSYQLIAAGQDSLFGTAPGYSPVSTASASATWELGTTTTNKIYPAGTGYSSDDLDNVTNFSQKATLGDAKP